MEDQLTQDSRRAADSPGATAKRAKPAPHSDAKDQRSRREAEALRQNLLRRKAQSRARDKGNGVKGSPEGDPEGNP